MRNALLRQRHGKLASYSATNVLILSEIFQIQSLQAIADCQHQAQKNQSLYARLSSLDSGLSNDCFALSRFVCVSGNVVVAASQKGAQLRYILSFFRDIHTRILDQREVDQKVVQHYLKKPSE